MTSQEFQSQARILIDDLKAVCANHGLGNDGNEYKIITQAFLYKFLNDKFAHQAKQIEPSLAEADDFPAALAALPDSDYQMLCLQLGGSTARLKPTQLLSTLWDRQTQDDFHELLDTTLLEIAAENSDVFSVKTDGGSRIVLFERISQYVSDPGKRDEFCRALINKLVPFSFERIFSEKFDFYATLFEYLIQDYNKDGGGKYAEYYTPHAVSKIMAACLVTEDQSNVTCYDPSAGSGTLLMNLAHAIGEDRCTLYSQDISQKSSSLLRLNLILNDLVHSIPNIIQGNTIQSPYHQDGSQLKKFDFIVSNPPFKLDFSDFRDELDTEHHAARFFAGIPKITAKSKDKMAIYLLFLQHIIHSLTDTGKAAVVVPTGFITAQSGIDKKIRQHLVENKMLAGVVSMPSNIFATTGTNVSILFIDATNKGDVILIDASALGTKVKEGKNQKTLLSPEEEQRIIDTFNTKEEQEDFSVVASYEQITKKNFSLSAGQYFEVKIEYSEMSESEFGERLNSFKQQIEALSKQSAQLDVLIKSNLESLKYEEL